MEDMKERKIVCVCMTNWVIGQGKGSAEIVETWAREQSFHLEALSMEGLYLDSVLGASMPLYGSRLDFHTHALDSADAIIVSFAPMSDSLHNDTHAWAKYHQLIALELLQIISYNKLFWKNSKPIGVLLSLGHFDQSSLLMSVRGVFGNGPEPFRPVIIDTNVSHLLEFLARSVERNRKEVECAQ